ncbi:protein YgfX [Achromobacter deleyi]|uniref:protein YgfX n=1 Tax=Achromobacter deleyi TaxID=1353891 RepID=UPI002DD42DED|nr:protein YgfX [Achromobacter deleyi]
MASAAQTARWPFAGSDLEGSVRGHWSFRIPVSQPRGATTLFGLALATAAASAVTAASWHGQAWAGIALVAVLLVLAGLLHSARSTLSPVTELRTAAGAGRWQVRRPQGWQDALLLDQQRGPAWLTLTLQPLPTGSTAFTTSKITLTVWRQTLRPESWRRLRLLTGAARRARPAVLPQEAS